MSSSPKPIFYIIILFSIIICIIAILWPTDDPGIDSNGNPLSACPFADELGLNINNNNIDDILYKSAPHIILAGQNEEDCPNYKFRKQQQLEEQIDKTHTETETIISSSSTLTGSNTET